MRKKIKIIKVTSNQPFALLGVCSEFGECKVIGNVIYIATCHYLKDIKQSFNSLFMSGYNISIVTTYTSELLQWIEDLQINNIIKQIKNYKK